MRPKSAIQKGKELEQHIADQIIARGLDSKCCRSAGSGNGNREKADIHTSMTILGRQAGIEAKNHAVPHVKEWWLQTKKLEILDQEPILVYKLKGEGYDEAKAVVYLSTLLDLIKTSSGIDMAQDNNYKPINSGMKWIIKNCIESLKKLLKELENIA